MSEEEDGEFVYEDIYDYIEEADQLYGEKRDAKDSASEQEEDLTDDDISTETGDEESDKVMSDKIVLSRDRWGNPTVYREGKHVYRWNNYCAAYVCEKCGDHAGKSGCFCGWSKYGGVPEAETEEVEE